MRAIDHYERLIEDHSRLLLDGARLERRLARVETENDQLRRGCTEVGLRLEEALERLRCHIAR